MTLRKERKLGWMIVASLMSVICVMCRRLNTAFCVDFFCRHSQNACERRRIIGMSFCSQHDCVQSNWEKKKLPYLFFADLMHFFPSFSDDGINDELTFCYFTAGSIQSLRPDTISTSSSSSVSVLFFFSSQITVISPHFMNNNSFFFSFFIFDRGPHLSAHTAAQTQHKTNEMINTTIHRVEAALIRRLENLAKHTTLLHTTILQFCTFRSVVVTWSTFRRYFTFYDENLVGNRLLLIASMRRVETKCCKEIDRRA